MANMSPEKNEVRCQEPSERIKNFDEVAYGYDVETAVSEAERCLNCKNKPCVDGCPVNIDIPAFIGKIKQREFVAAYKIIRESSSLPAVCGRVCPQEKQCEERCVRGKKGEPVGIGRLERFADTFYSSRPESFKTPELPESNGHKAAVIGSGPAGLSCAGELIRMGYSVTVFEALHVAGGVLVYGIPEFRLPKTIVQREIYRLMNLGVTIETNTVIGKTFSIGDLFENGFKAVFIGSGAGLPNFMGIKGENLNGVYSANEFLTRINLMKAQQEDSDTPIMPVKNIAVVGGGNVAMDAARCAKRLGAENVYIIYRRSENEMPARKEEVLHAKEEGIIFKFLTNPAEITDGGDFSVNGVKCVEMELGEPDESGRRSPVPIEGSEFILEADSVIIAVGTSPNPLIRDTTEGIKTNGRGCFITDENCRTSIEGIYAGGDAVTGAATVILAMGEGKKAAKAMDEYIRGNITI